MAGSNDTRKPRGPGRRARR